MSSLGAWPSWTKLCGPLKRNGQSVPPTVKLEKNKSRWRQHELHPLMPRHTTGNVAKWRGRGGEGRANVMKGTSYTRGMKTKKGNGNTSTIGKKAKGRRLVFCTFAVVFETRSNRWAFVQANSCHHEGHRYIYIPSSWYCQRPPVFWTLGGLLGTDMVEIYSHTRI